MAALLVLAIFISGTTSSTSLSITSLQTLHTYEVQQNGSTLILSNSQNSLFNMTGSEVQQILTKYKPLLDQLRNTTTPTSSGYVNTSTYTHIQLDESTGISISNITLPSLSITPPAGAPTQVSQDTSYGSVPWSDLDGVKTENDSSASASQSGGYYTTHILKTYGYGFNISASATVTGIKVEFKCYATFSGTQVAVNQLYKASGQVGQSRTGATLNTSLGWMSYGNATDLWGASWSPSDVNDIGFGLALAYKMLSGGVYVDAVRITVYYTSPPSGTPNTQTFLIISYRSNATSYCVRISTVALFANGAYQSCATFLNYGSAQFNVTNSVGDCLIFNFTHTLSQHYSLIADALISIVNNTYAPLAQQNQTAYQLTIAYTALSEHAGRLADFTAAHLQAYNRQIIQATVLAADPPYYGEGVIWDDYIPLCGGGVIPTGGSGAPPIGGGQGPLPQLPTNLVIQTSATTGLTWDELFSVCFEFTCLVTVCFLPSLYGVYSHWPCLQPILIPIFLKMIATWVTLGGKVLDGTLGVIDFLFTIVGAVIEMASAVILYYLTHISFWEALGAQCVFAVGVASGIGLAIALAGLAIGAACLLLKFIWCLNN